MLIPAIRQAYLGQEDKTVLIIGNRRYSCIDLMAAVEQQAAHFHRAGLVAGDSLLSLLPNGWHSVVVLLAAAECGLVYVPLPLASTQAAVATASQRVGAKAVVAWQPLVEDLHGACPAIDWYCVYANEPIVICHASTADSPVAPDAPVVESAPYILTMTSGSTGDPKPIVLSQKTKFLRAQAAIELYGLTAGDITLAATPLYHSLAQRLLFVALLSGGTLVLMNKYHKQRWLEIIQQEQVTFTIAASSQLQQLVGEQPVANYLTSLRVLVSSSALLATDVKRALLTQINCRFHECYGASEVAIVSDVAFTPAVPLGSVGRLLPGVKAKIVDDQGEPLPANNVGEICVQSPMAFSGYFQQPQVTAQSYYEGYFKTGDLGYFDTQGFLFFAGRKKEIIISGGVNIYPSDVEAVVNGFAGVQESAAFPYPDGQLGEAVAVAVVAAADTLHNPSLLTLAAAEQLADFQLPRHWFFVEQLPKTALGKLQRSQLVPLLVPATEVAQNTPEVSL
ncbi:class I adenylate-forming enzyme family protein [Halioxenophilus sp. WMMB6]|uniref:class I adenylate-forming enzyme family protein n=1 Tax=Halioxenophilus sp. WMMB6 TaxID=3073815 RepID=UPI00295E98E7|nr:class I adenylate-forming enzyme family protein [Halioxenophilus sp. WMMB6]